MMSAYTPTLTTLPHISPFAKRQRVADSILNTSFPTMPDLDKSEDASCDMAHQKRCFDLTSSTPNAQQKKSFDEEMTIAQVLASLGGQSSFAVSNI